ncbi:MAG: MFS transporter, partial [Chitinophagia bacterium]|nr:MFS transporter [Chitinophagia bacterium]
MAGATDKGLSKKVHRSWAMYDWANSAYNLVVTSTIFPAYYNAITTQKSNGVIVNDKVVLWGIAFKNSALFDYAIAFAYLLVGLLSPFLSSIADNGGRRIYFLQFFCSIGALACCGLYGFVPGGVGWGIFCATVAAIGYCGSIVFYNAYLPEIALPAEQDKVSALGYAYGYVGSVLLQLVCFVFVLCPGTFGITDDTFPPRLSFLLVGLWWWGFGQVSFRGLQSKANHAKEAATMQFNAVWGGLVRVWHGIKRNKVVKYYLIAFFVYSMGVQTVMLAATIFGSKELKLQTAQLIAVILIIQLVAIVGAWGMARLSDLWGNLNVLLLVVLIWIGVCIAAYFITDANGFYAVA